jgi:hypothetical protein
MATHQQSQLAQLVNAIELIFTATEVS